MIDDGISSRWCEHGNRRALCIQCHPPRPVDHTTDGTE